MGFYADKFTRNIPGYGTYGNLYSTAPNVAEMMLIRAECLARNNHPNEAMQALNDFRKYRIANNAPDEVLKLTANNKDEAIKLVMENVCVNFHLLCAGMIFVVAILTLIRMMM